MSVDLGFDAADFDRARHGLIAEPDPASTNDWGMPIWNATAYAFLDGEPADTVHPGLWRQAQLNAIAGLFEVTDGVYQVRGIDISNVTFIAGDDGWVVIDPLTTTGTAAAALSLLHEHVPARPVTALIYTHSHVDHFGGARGVLAAAKGDIPIVAPVGFLEAAIDENVHAGIAMRRRAAYMYGSLLPIGPQGHVDCGLGKAIPPPTNSGLVPPTVDITETGTELELDGVRIVFQLTPDTEAPAEMNFMFPELRALCMAENCTGTLHNVYTPRGAPVRDALGWSRYIDEAIRIFGAETDIVFASHNWPRLGHDDAIAHLGRQRDLYRFIHDQTLRLANHGFTSKEIAETLTLPPDLEGDASAHGYYGTVKHNTKAVYQRYLGWFDANPANLDPHPPVEAATRYVEFMGGADAVLTKARESFFAGDFRWVAEVVNHVVFADPTNIEARGLQADALEQLGYRAESGPWRDFYLTGAQELRHGVPNLPAMPAATGDVTSAMTVGMLLDHLAIRLDGLRASGLKLTVQIDVTDREEQHAMALEHSAIRHHEGTHSGEADTYLRTTHADLAQLCLGTAAPNDLADTEITGDRASFDTLVSLLDTFAFWFPIVEP